ncbi:putative F420-dependent oxidoreductase [Saccharomonospora marina XMU15]|uniref:Putative F420-dependent oxidoreductase n=1 Tax=Saccharomonospora marina XMU15 TaxID=882083 RepID=H5X5M1_9PSEU|nr:putative F420-dependent oxidoreductase [Saccharomonospora marina XMU15]
MAASGTSIVSALVRLGLNLGYWGATSHASGVGLAKQADDLGYSVVWVAEAYGSDAATVLAWIAAQTTSVDIGSAVLQIPARTPAATAMTAATLDSLSGGRFRLGLGVSGPQVSEGWHGVRFASPLGRTREYVDIVRAALRRERLRYNGKHFQLPLPDGPGKALKLTIHPVREWLPVYLAAIGPRNLELTGEIADGWLPVFFSPEHAHSQFEHLRAGAERAGRSLDGFDIAPTVPLVPGSDWKVCADAVRPYAALYIGGMGSRERNFYNELACRMGFEAEAARIQQHYLAKEYEAAMAQVPLEFIDATSLLGPRERIAERMAALAEAGVTTLTVAPYLADADAATEALRTAVAALELSGVA